MAITNYTELQTAVTNWMQRTDLATARVQEFIALAEAQFNRTLRLTGQLTRADVACSARWTDISGLATPIAEIRSASITTGGVRYALDYLALDKSQDLYATGTPVWYTRAGNELGLFPPPSSAVTVELIYWRTVPDLATNSTSWLLTLAPDLYLYRSVLEGAHYTRDTDLAQRAEANYLRALDELKRDDQGRQFGGSGLEMRAA